MAVVRHRQAGGPTAAEFAEAIEVSSDATWLLLSGVGPRPLDPTAPVPDYGDTERQTADVLERIQEVLAAHGYGMGDVVKMTGFLAGDPALGGEADFAGFSRAYSRYFNTASQPEIPVRMRAQVIRFVPDGWLVEIDVMAARAG
jgi:enamine deaminase RidA (YjgF/YER057c/UK114 family)